MGPAVEIIKKCWLTGLSLRAQRVNRNYEWPKGKCVCTFPLRVEEATSKSTSKTKQITVQAVFLKDEER